MRTWVPVAGLVVSVAMPALADTRVTIRELKEHPAPYYGQTVTLECYYDKESPIWVRALPDADAWIGFFVTGRPEKALTWSGEYYNLLFAPRELQETVRALRGGDKITVIGEAFHYYSQSLDGAGIHVQQILQGWGSDAKAIGQAALAAPEPSGNQRASSPAAAGKYTATINGKRYEGLRFGDPYNFDGVEFQVDEAGR